MMKGPYRVYKRPRLTAKEREKRKKRDEALIRQLDKGVFPKGSVSYRRYIEVGKGKGITLHFEVVHLGSKSSFVVSVESEVLANIAIQSRSSVKVTDLLKKI
jgi:hypothetical protein